MPEAAESGQQHGAFWSQQQKADTRPEHATQPPAPSTTGPPPPHPALTRPDHAAQPAALPRPDHAAITDRQQPVSVCPRCARRGSFSNSRTGKRTSRDETHQCARGHARVLGPNPPVRPRPRRPRALCGNPRPQGPLPRRRSTRTRSEASAPRRACFRKQGRRRAASARGSGPPGRKAFEHVPTLWPRPSGPAASRRAAMREADTRHRRQRQSEG